MSADHSDFSTRSPGEIRRGARGNNFLNYFRYSYLLVWEYIIVVDVGSLISGGPSRAPRQKLMISSERVLAASRRQ